MDKNELIRIARAAGIDHNSLLFDIEVLIDRDTLNDFAKIVAAMAKREEREACAKLIEVSDDVADWEIICGSDGRVLLNAMAEAIRARGEPTSRGNHNELKSSK